MLFPYIFYYGGQVCCPPQQKSYGKTMIFTNPYLLMYICKIKGVLQTSIPTDGIMHRLPGATVAFVHETIRILNMCHCGALKILSHSKPGMVSFNQTCNKLALTLVSEICLFQSPLYLNYIHTTSLAVHQNQFRSELINVSHKASWPHIPKLQSIHTTN